MKCLAFFLLVIQVERVSTCAFDKVETIPDIMYNRGLSAGENECFAECYNDKSCIAHRYHDESRFCLLFYSGNGTYSCPYDFMCYILQRDEVDLTCQTYLNI